MTRPALVTGAAGFAGKHLVDLLSQEGVNVRALYRPGGRSPDHEGERASAPGAGTVTWEAVDVLDRASIEAAIAEACPSAVYHCAAAAHAGESWRRVAATLELNVIGTHNVLEAVRRSGPDIRVVVPGSAMVYRPAETALDEESPLGPTNPYAVSKLAQEMLASRAAADDGLHVLLPRAFNHTGPGQDDKYATSNLARQIAAIEAGMAEPVLKVGNLDARRDVTDVRDTVRAYRCLVERGTPGRIYNVCRGRAYAIRDLLDILVRQAGVAVDVRIDPELLRPNDTPVVLGSPRRTREEVGWEAAIPLERTLADLLAYWRGRVRAEARRS